MRIGKLSDIRAGEITPESIYQRRRDALKMLGLGAIGLVAGCSAGNAPSTGAGTATAEPNPDEKPLAITKKDEYVVSDPQTSYMDATHYNNYYEFGTDKSDPARTSGQFKPQPWSVEIAGHAEVVGKFTLEDILKPHALEERVYRHRCVEGWSMVIPWSGIALGDLLKRFKPTAQAKYVAFTTVQRPAEMPGLARDVLDWPYREGLRINEAMHPLAFLAVGLYGRALPNQNGAPLRLIVPWKYGFKGAKSIVKIEFLENMPRTTWNLAAPNEYGFYSNVNPAVDHPRWSQRTERRIAGDGFSVFGNRIETKPFNGYADQVASLYAGMDLRKDF